MGASLMMTSSPPSNNPPSRPHLTLHTQTFFTQNRARMRRRSRRPSLPAAAAAVWTCLCLFRLPSSAAAVRQPQAFAPSTITTTMRLSVPMPYLVYVTPAIPAEATAQEAWFERVQQCAQAGVPMVQIRDKVLSSEALAPHVMRCRQHLDATAAQQHPRTLLLVNGHPDMHVGLDGAHFPEAIVERIPDVLLREQKGEEAKQQQPFVTGASVHSVEAAVKAARMGVDYLQVGTMYLTGSHPEKLQVEGPALMAAIDTTLRKAQLRERVRLCGIGGITPSNCEAVLEAGADGMAVISGIAAEDGDVARTVAAFREVFARVNDKKQEGVE